MRGEDFRVTNGFGGGLHPLDGQRDRGRHAADAHFRREGGEVRVSEQRSRGSVTGGHSRDETKARLALLLVSSIARPPRAITETTPAMARATGGMPTRALDAGATGRVPAAGVVCR